VSIKSVLFIDANQYLDLYRTVGGEKLLAALQEQQGHIFVTVQVVDEVYRQKLSATATFLAAKVNESKPNDYAVPDHLPARVVNAIRERTRERLQKIREKLSRNLLEQVSQSKDEVSKALAGLFSQAIPHTDGELQRARARKERGNPPGKSGDPLGDQLCWEQILSQCQDKPVLWIITNDSDYGTKHGREMLLNAGLYRELTHLYESVPPVHCFTNIIDGLEHFAKTTGTKAEKLPTAEEAEQIKKEQESLLPLGWLVNYDDSFPVAIQSTYSWGDSTMLTAALRSQVASEEVILPPATKDADQGST
jgi:hypothetical protein